jgi:multisubunit Na+/H+ antiporter MnhF subunit
MNEWEIAAAVLAAGLAPCLAVSLTASIAAAFIALEVAGTIVVTVLMVLSEGLQRQPFIDLALTLAAVSVVGALAIARLLERDL